MHGIIDKSDIFGLIGPDNYQEEVLVAKANLQTARIKHQKDFKEKAFLNKVLTLPNAFLTLCQMHQNGFIDNNDLKASKPTSRHILTLPEDTLVYILNTGIFSDAKISSYDLVNQYGKNLSGDKCILLAKQGFIYPEDLINTINMESVSRTSPELAIDPIALINFYEPEVLLDMYKKDKAEGKYGKRLSKKFINTFNEKTISPAKIEKYRKKIKDKPQFAEEELGRVIILLNSNVEIKKSELLAMFYRSYINEEIDWSTFCEFSDITSRLFISDLQLLYEIYRGNISDTSQCPVYKADRLIALGLLDSAMKSMSIGSVSGSQTQRYIQTNNLGKQFCSITLS